MTPKTHTVELDEETALSLQMQAREHGLSVSELVAQMAILQAQPIGLGEDEIAELDRQWAAIKAGERTFAHDEVVQWLESWGRPDFKPWRDR
jgi:predicted transcriptional regulator